MLENSILYYLSGNKVIMRDESRGVELDVTKGFPHQEYQSLVQAEREEIRNSSLYNKIVNPQEDRGEF